MIALPARTPPAAASISAISESLINRISQALSCWSASWPAVAEHKKNGRMNSPPASGIKISADFCEAASLP